MTSSNGPKPGTMMRRVWESQRQGLSRQQIAREHNTSLKVVSTTIQNLRREGYLSRPTPTDTLETMRASVSSAKGGIGLAIEPYARLGMSPREIVIALQLEPGKTYPVKSVSRALARARRVRPTGGLADRLDVRSSCRLPERQLRARVRVWLLCRNWLQARGDEPPQSRLEWRQAIASWYGEMESILTLRGAMPDEAASIVRGEACKLPSAAFVREALFRGLLTADLFHWHELDELYQRGGPKTRLPLAERVRLELLLHALRSYKNLDLGPLNTFKQLPESLDSSFAGAENRAIHHHFLALSVFCPWAHGEDGKGLYFIRNGSKSYPCASDADGSIVFDTMRLALQRWQARHTQVEPLPAVLTPFLDYEAASTTWRGATPRGIQPMIPLLRPQPSTSAAPTF